MHRKKNPDAARKNQPARKTMLTQFSSQAEVAEALAEGDNEELQADVDEKLDNIRRRVRARQWAWLDVDLPWQKEDYVIEGIVDHVMPFLVGVPREDVTKGVRHELARSSAGLFYADDGRSINYRTGTAVAETYFQSELYIPFDEDHEGLIPHDLVLELLEGEVASNKNGLGDWHEHEAHNADRADAWSIVDDGEPVRIFANDEKLEELLHDIRAAHFSKLFEKDPEAAKAAFIDQVGNLLDYQVRSRLLRSKDQIPDEAWGDLCTAFWSKSNSKEEALAEISELLDEYLDLLEAPSFAEHDPQRIVGVIDFKPRPQLDARGRPKTDLPEVDRSPWTIIRLTPGDLAMEGARLRHCVGQKDMSYHRALRDEQIEIWSVRTASGKPLFTIEVDASIHDPKPPGFSQEEFEEGRALAIKQVKGTANRTPGFDSYRATHLTRPNEVKRLSSFFKSIGVDPASVADLSDGLDALAPDVSWREGGPLENPSRTTDPNAERSFDLPYQPLYEGRVGR